MEAHHFHQVNKMKNRMIKWLRWKRA